MSGDPWQWDDTLYAGSATFYGPGSLTLLLARLLRTCSAPTGSASNTPGTSPSTSGGE